MNIFKHMRLKADLRAFIKKAQALGLGLAESFIKYAEDDLEYKGETKEFIFGRINDWLTVHYGQNHGIKLGVTEMDIQNSTPSVVATWYASMLGEFMKNDVEMFTPWSWKTGMWETLHLFARYNKTQSVQGTSSDETFVSAYPSVNAAKDSMTVVLVNRSTIDTKNTTLNFTNYILQSTSAEALRLASLPSTETFISHTQNAITRTIVNFTNNSATITLPPLSITSLTIKGRVGRVSTLDLKADAVKIYPNPFTESFKIEVINGGFNSMAIYNLLGQQVFNQKLNPSDKLIEIKKALPSGVYFVELIGENGRIVKEITAIDK